MRLTRPALRDIDRAVEYYLRAAPAQAERFYDEVRQVMSRLADHPESSQRTSRATVRRAVLTHFPFVVFYALVADEVVIHHVRHASRRPWAG